MQKKQKPATNFGPVGEKMRELWEIKILVSVIMCMSVIIIMLASRCSYEMPAEIGPFLVFHPEDGIPPDWFLDIIDTSSNPPDTIFISWDSIGSQ